MAALTALCLTHRRLPLQLLERFPRGAATESVFASLQQLPQVSGCVVLSTCNRFEVYATSNAPLELGEIVEAVAQSVHIPASDWAAVADHLTDRDAVHHLFSVAAGVDSRLVGEHEVLGQVRACAQASARAGFLDMDLARLTQWAVRAGRRARRSLDPVGTRTSLAVQAVEVLQSLLGDLTGRRVLLLGAGQLGTRVAAALTSSGAATVLCARDVGKAEVATGAASVEPITLLPDLLGTVDAVVCATSATAPLVTSSMLRAVVPVIQTRRLLIIDLAVPRNVDRAVASLPGVHYLDLDDLAAHDGSAVDTNPNVAAARDVVEAEVTAYATALTERAVTDLLQRVIRHGEQVREAELLRIRGRMPAAEFAVADDVSRRMMNKLLHPILTGIRATAASGDIDAALATASVLFGDHAGSPDRRRSPLDGSGLAAQSCRSTRLGLPNGSVSHLSSHPT